MAGKALFEMNASGKESTSILCMHDRQDDADRNKYFPSEMFRGFGGNRMAFIYAAVRQSHTCHTVILSHINLILVGWLIKKISPKTKVIMFAHGIEVWSIPELRKKRMLKCCDLILSVSSFTSEKIQAMHRIPTERCRVLNNCLDPFLPNKTVQSENLRLRNRYHYSTDDKIIFTLTRLSSKERYKGYDKVLESMNLLSSSEPDLKYLIAGSYDDLEKRYLEQLIDKFGLRDKVTIAGFIPDDELVGHFSMADVYVMPSMKEGFGIVFIEAMYYHLPVIGGDRDGSVDALCNGRLGKLVDPLDTTAIAAGIKEIIDTPERFVPDRKLLMEQFSYEQYKRRFEKLLHFPEAALHD